MYKTTLAALALGALLCPLTAAPVAISDQLTVFNGSNTIVAQLTVFQDGTFAGGACIGVTFGPCTPGTEFGNGYYLTDSTLAAQANAVTTVWDTNPTIIQDAFGDTRTAPTGGAFFLGFISDDESGTSLGTPSTTNIQEPANGIMSATQYLSPSLIAQGYTATFFSDPSEAPEPGTIVLLGLGLAAVAGCKGRRYIARCTAQSR